jgi:hypothetical protein
MVLKELPIVRSIFLKFYEFTNAEQEISRAVYFSAASDAQG